MDSGGPIPRAPTTGFTLLEVLVALSIVSVGLTAAFQAINSSVTVRERTELVLIASMIASNHLNRIKVASAWPPRLNTTSTEKMAGYSWNVEERSTSTANQDIVRIDVAVNSEESEVGVNYFFYKANLNSATDEVGSVEDADVGGGESDA